MNQVAPIILSFITGMLIFQSCEKEKGDPAADLELYNEINSGNYSYYQNGTVLPAAAPSPHGPFKLKFNAIAQAALDSTGELPAGGSFPSGSVIVKEIQSNGQLSVHAVMKKSPSASNSASGWIWAEFNADGSVLYGSGKKGKACTGCHGGSPNRDMVRSFDLH